MSLSIDIEVGKGTDVSHSRGGGSDAASGGGCAFTPLPYSYQRPVIRAAGQFDQVGRGVLGWSPTLAAGKRTSGHAATPLEAALEAPVLDHIQLRVFKRARVAKRLRAGRTVEWQGKTFRMAQRRNWQVVVLTTALSGVGIVADTEVGRRGILDHNRFLAIHLRRNRKRRGFCML